MVYNNTYPVIKAIPDLPKIQFYATTVCDSPQFHPNFGIRPYNLMIWKKPSFWMQVKLLVGLGHKSFDQFFNLPTALDGFETMPDFPDDENPKLATLWLHSCQETKLFMLIFKSIQTTLSTIGGIGSATYSLSALIFFGLFMRAFLREVSGDVA